MTFGYILKNNAIAELNWFDLVLIKHSIFFIANEFDKKETLAIRRLC